MKLKYKTRKDLVPLGKNLPALISHPIANHEPPILIMPNQSSSRAPALPFDKDVALTKFAYLCFKLAGVCLLASAFISAMEPI